VSRSRFEGVHARLVELVAAGETLTEACERVEVPYTTVRKWIADGHRNPEGRYGRFTEALDAARASVQLDRQEEGGYDPGPVEREVRKLIAGHNLDDHGRIAAAQARVLARQVGTLRPPEADRRPWALLPRLGGSMT
jgi:hypothetical protein